MKKNDLTDEEHPASFSYHSEHHVFPAMPPRFYPQVSHLLQTHFPDRYQRLPFAEAWRRLWLKDEFIVEPQRRDGERPRG